MRYRRRRREDGALATFLGVLGGVAGIGLGALIIYLLVNHGFLTL